LELRFHDHDRLCAIEDLDERADWNRLGLIGPRCHFELGTLNRHFHLSVAVGRDFAHDTDVVRVFVELFRWVADPVEPGLQDEDPDKARAGSDRYLVARCQGGHSVSDEAGQTEESQKRGQQVGRWIAQTLEVFVGGDDNFVAELGRVEKASRETGDQREGEPTEKYEQIGKSPGHCHSIAWRIRN
jgi:hypothetical protein